MFAYNAILEELYFGVMHSNSLIVVNMVQEGLFALWLLSDFFLLMSSILATFSRYFWRAISSFFYIKIILFWETYLDQSKSY